MMVMKGASLKGKQTHNCSKDITTWASECFKKLVIKHILSVSDCIPFEIMFYAASQHFWNRGYTPNLGKLLFLRSAWFVLKNAPIVLNVSQSNVFLVLDRRVTAEENEHSNNKTHHKVCSSSLQIGSTVSAVLVHKWTTCIKNRLLSHTLIHPHTYTQQQR